MSRFRNKEIDYSGMSDAHCAILYDISKSASEMLWVLHYLKDDRTTVRLLYDLYEFRVTLNGDHIEIDIYDNNKSYISTIRSNYHDYTDARSLFERVIRECCS